MGVQGRRIPIAAYVACCSKTAKGGNIAAKAAREGNLSVVGAIRHPWRTRQGVSELTQSQEGYSEHFEAISPTAREFCGEMNIIVRLIKSEPRGSCASYVGAV